MLFSTVSSNISGIIFAGQALHVLQTQNLALREQQAILQVRSTEHILSLVVSGRFGWGWGGLGTAWHSMAQPRLGDNWSMTNIDAVLVSGETTGGDTRSHKCL